MNCDSIRPPFQLSQVVCRPWAYLVLISTPRERALAVRGWSTHHSQVEEQDRADREKSGLREALAGSKVQDSLFGPSHLVSRFLAALPELPFRHRIPGHVLFRIHEGHAGGHFVFQVLEQIFGEASLARLTSFGSRTNPQAPRSLSEGLSTYAIPPYAARRRVRDGHGACALHAPSVRSTCSTHIQIHHIYSHRYTLRCTCTPSPLHGGHGGR